MKIVNGYEVPESKREFIDSLVLQKVKVEYKYNPEEPEGISYYIVGTLDKVEAEYEVDEISRKISFGLNNIKSVKVSFIYDTPYITIYLCEEK